MLKVRRAKGARVLTWTLYPQMKYLLVLIYTGASSFIYFRYLYREDVAAILTFIIPTILFLPILLSVSEHKLNLLYLNSLTLFAFCAGFIAAVSKLSNIWPMALMAWLALSIPGIVMLNVIAFIYKRYNKSLNLTGAKDAPPS